jgi:broad specificity phosphatase PhoE
MNDRDQRIKYQITLLRHGESTGNAERIYQGHSEFDLTERGQAQSHALASRWQEEGTTFEQIISSPLARARQTAEIIAEKLSVPLEFDPNWKEIDNGVLAGLTLQQAAEHYPFPDFMTPFEPIGQSGESNWDLYLRAGQSIKELLDRPAGKYLVVSHGGFLTRVMYAILGIIPQANFSGARFRFRNSGFAVVYYDPARHIWLVDRLNDSAHWAEDTDPLD